MSLSGLHFLLTYRCTESCDHCFVFGSPRAPGHFDLPTLCRMLEEGERLGTVDSVFFEGGEPFLLYDLLVAGVREARSRGFSVGVVTNAFWATSPEAAAEKLRPLGALGLSDLSISDDELHGNLQRAATARAAARDLGIPADSLHVDASTPGSVMYRGRAAEKLAGKVPGLHWTTFTCCPHEQLDTPGRVHLDAHGWVHLCQGLTMGNCLQTPLVDLARTYDPEGHPIVAPILKGGPAELARVYGLPDQELYADACHLCYMVRSRLRGAFAQYLAPDHVYGE